MSTWRKVGCCLAMVAGLGAREEDAATPRISASAYVTNGIVVHMDAIDNIGFGQHSNDAGVWKDLAGDNDIVLSNDVKNCFTDGQLKGWTDTALQTDASSNKGVYSIPSTRNYASYQMIEVALKLGPDAAQAILNGSGSSRTQFVAYQKSSVTFRNGSNTIIWPAGSWLQAAALYDKYPTQPDIYTNGTKVLTKNGAVLSYTSAWGSSTGLGRGTNAHRFRGGEYYSIRLYDHVLTPEQIAYNAMLDNVRYNGASLPDGYRAANGKVECSVRVTVVGGKGTVSVNGVEGTEAWVPAWTTATVSYALSEGEVLASAEGFPETHKQEGTTFSDVISSPWNVTLRIASQDRVMVIAPIPDQVYDSDGSRPGLSVSTGTGRALEEGVHYTVAYSNNLVIGTATAYAIGIGEFEGERSTAEFQVRMPVSAYVQRGLISHWDAIDNVGTGVHDPEAGVWKDLCETANDIVVSNYFGNQLQGWTDTSLKTGTGASNIPFAKNCTSYVTVEACARCLYTAQQILFNFGASKLVGLWTSGSVGFYKESPIYVTTDREWLQAAAVHYPSISSPLAYTNGAPTVARSGETAHFSTGMGASTCLGRGTSSSPFLGEYCALRLYSRPLSESEVALNAALDRVRFNGGTPKLPEGWWWSRTQNATLARVRVDTAGGRGTLTVNGQATNEVLLADQSQVSIAYQPAAGEFVREIVGCPDDATVDGSAVSFVSDIPRTIRFVLGDSTRTMLVDPVPPQVYTGSEIRPVESVHTFEGAVLTAGEDYDVIYGDNVEVGVASARVVGKGSFADEEVRIEFAIQIPVSAYARRGLISQWDAIDNVGTGVHDPEAGVWKDLCETANDIVISNYFGTQLLGWTDTSLKTVNGASNIPFTKNCSDYVTIEACAHCSYSAQQILFNAGASKFVGLWTSGSVGFYMEAPTYVTADRDWLQTAAVHLPSPSAPLVYTNGAPTVTRSGEKAHFSSGMGKSTCLGRGTSSTPFQGEYCAIRLYSRALSEPEIALNAALDRVRFNGGTPRLPDGWRWDPSTGRMLSRVTVSFGKGHGTGVINGVKTNEMWFAEGTPVEVSYFSRDARDHVEGATCSLPEGEFDGRKVSFVSGVATFVDFDIRVGLGTVLFVR